MGPTLSFKHYVLAGGEVLEVDFFVYLLWQDANPESYRVALDKVNDSEISTVFLFSDHDFRTPSEERGPGYKPLIFETMVFGGPLDDYCERYRSLDEAKAGHARIAAEVRKALKGDAVG